MPTEVAVAGREGDGRGREGLARRALWAEGSRAAVAAAWFVNEEEKRGKLRNGAFSVFRFPFSFFVFCPTPKHGPKNTAQTRLTIDD